jgi:NAD(P)-dependent dehydrogenase (short-subunit alcohol dehydrogenase family)
MRLANRVALVTGAGSGIGRAIAHRFGKEGAIAVCADRKGDIAATTAEEIRAANGKALPITVDIAEADQVQAMVATVVAECGRIDILVNNAGVGLHRPFLDTSLEDWDRVMRVNLRGQFITAQAAAREMVKKGYGRIVNMASIQGQRGGSGRTAYGTSKAGLIQLTKIMAVELSPMGILVNAIAPGSIITPLTNMGPDQKRAFFDRMSVKRSGAPDEIAAAATFLASEECSYTTGHVLNVDGGVEMGGLIYSYDELVAERYVPKS